jgi:hypothetical protein
VLNRQEDEDKFVNFIGRSFGYYTSKAATHTFLPKNKQLDISILFLFVVVFGCLHYGLVLSLDVK